MQDKKKFYEAKWFLWLFLIIFPPIGIILLWVVHKDMKKNKKIILSAIFAIWFIILVVAMNGDNSTTDNKVDKQQKTKSTKQTQATTEQQETTYAMETEISKPKNIEKATSETKKSQKNKEFTNEEIEGQVKKAIKDDMGKDEYYSVVFRDGYLFVRVDFSEVDPTPLTFEDLAIARTSSITDTILDLTDIYNLWDKITVSFGANEEEIGDITNTKDDVEKNEFGGRYFPQENFALE